MSMIFTHFTERTPPLSVMLAIFDDIPSVGPRSSHRHDCNICIHGLGGFGMFWLGVLVGQPRRYCTGASR